MPLIDRRSYLKTLLAGAIAAPAMPCAWADDIRAATLAGRFSPPAGYTRTPVLDGSFAAWLRRLPLLPDQSPVRLHNGKLKHRQDIHAAVLDFDVGAADLQQCADAVMRLRAEWMFATGRADAISFNDTGSAAPMPWSRWAAGERPTPKGRRLEWSRKAPPDASRASFRRYLDTVFIWAGTASLERELDPVPAAQIEPGDVVIKGGFPGHAVIVVDAVQNMGTGQRRVLLAQSYMPAQSIHILRNLISPVISPWYEIEDGRPVATPEWTFPPGSLRRWHRATQR